jgi:hypothetical protein
LIFFFCVPRLRRPPFPSSGYCVADFEVHSEHALLSSSEYWIVFPFFCFANRTFPLKKISEKFPFVVSSARLGTPLSRPPVDPHYFRRRRRNRARTRPRKGRWFVCVCLYLSLCASLFLFLRPCAYHSLYACMLAPRHPGRTTFIF